MSVSKRIQLVLVVETDRNSGTDDPYYTWILRNHFSEYVLSSIQNDLKIVYQFVHMGGFGNFESPRVKQEIRSYLNSFAKGDTYVVYCLDYDNKGNDTRTRLQEIQDYCKKHNYGFCLAYPEIEHVLKNVRNGLSKVEAAACFKKHYPKKSEISEEKLFASLNAVAQEKGQTNFGVIILDIIAKARG